MHWLVRVKVLQLTEKVLLAERFLDAGAAAWLDIQNVQKVGGRDQTFPEIDDVDNFCGDGDRQSMFIDSIVMRVLCTLAQLPSMEASDCISRRLLREHDSLSYFSVKAAVMSAHLQ